MKTVIELVHARDIALVIVDLIIDLGAQDSIADGFQIRAIDHAVWQGQLASQRPGVPVDPVLFARRGAARAIRRAGGAQRGEDAYLADPFGEMTAFEPTLVPLVPIAVKPSEQNGDNEREFDADAVALHFRVMNEYSNQRRRHGQRRKKKIKDVRAAIDQ